LRVADAFPEGVGEFPNNPVTAAGFEAIFKGGKRAQVLLGGWSENESGGPVYVHRGRRGGRILVYPNPVDIGREDLPASDRLWQYVRKLNPLTADVALAVFAQLCEPTVGDRPKSPFLEPVVITADAVLRYKGIRRRGEERHQLIERIDDEMELLRSLHFDIELFKAFDPASRRFEAVSWRGDRLFDVVSVERTNETPASRERVEIAWLVRPGQWAYYWLDVRGRVYLGRIARGLLDLDHRDNRRPHVMAKKIGMRIMFLYHALRSSPLRIGIRNLLEDVGELHRTTDDRHWAARTRRAFERSMSILGSGDPFDHISGLNIFAKVEWPDGYGPADCDRYRGWVDKWLSSRISITMTGATPPPTDSARATPCPPLHGKRRIPHDVDLGAHLRKLRLSCEPRWTQEELARELGLSPSFVSLIENGKRQPSPKLEAKLKRWKASRSKILDQQ
jgi:DNA-binding XRE family transcriptional regulator